MPDPPSPGDLHDVLARAQSLGLDGRLGLLEQLDGVEEAAVVRAALTAGVPDVLVLDELRREVERRLSRTSTFYDQTQW